MPDHVIINKKSSSIERPRLSETRSICIPSKRSMMWMVPTPILRSLVLVLVLLAVLLVLTPLLLFVPVLLSVRSVLMLLVPLVPRLLLRMLGLAMRLVLLLGPGARGKS